MKNSSDIQREIPIKSTKPFLYEYWKVFSYLYFTKLSDKFIRNKSESYPKNLLKNISINNLIRIDSDNTDLWKERRTDSEKDKKKDTISLYGYNSVNNVNNNFVNIQNSSLNNNQNYPKENLNEGKNSEFPQQSNNLFDFNYMNPLFHNLATNPQNNNLFSYKQPQKYQNNLDLNPIFSIQNNFGKDLAPSNYLENYNNTENNKNFPFFQITPAPIIPAIPNNILPNPLPNTFLMNNTNTNININTKLNIQKENKNSDDKNNFKNKFINKNTDASKKPTSLKNEDTVNNKDDKNKQLLSSENNAQSSTNKNPPQKVHRVLFSIKESNPLKDGDMLSKKRKRFIKNNKLVFVQMEDNDLNLKNEKIYDEDKNFDFQQNTKPRGSRFRGVSKNGSQWQVLIMVKKKKRYLGSFASEEEAARAYDKVALQHHGNKAKTNYDYTKEEVDNILKGPKLLKVE